MARVYGFDDQSVERIREVVRTVEASPGDERDQRRRGVPFRERASQWIKCTNATADGDGRYEAVWVSYVEDTDTWTEEAACYLRPGANDESPAAGTIYRSWCQGVATDGLPVYVPIVTGGFSGARVRYYDGQVATRLADTDLEAYVADFDVGGYWNVSDPTKLTIPADGYYLVGACIGLHEFGQHIFVLTIVNSIGTTIAESYTGYTTALTVNLAPCHRNAVTLYHFTQGQYIKARVYHDAPTDATTDVVSSEGAFWITRMS